MKQINFIFLVSIIINFIYCSPSKAQCPAGGTISHNCGRVAGDASVPGGCASGCIIASTVCTGPIITGDCSQTTMSLTIVSPTPTCEMTVTGTFAKFGSCTFSGMDSGDQLTVGLNAMVTGASNADESSAYSGSGGQNISITGRSNRRDEVISYTVSCSGACSIPAPVDLLFFNGENTSDGIILTWATASERNNDYFSIEYSNDGIHFTEVLQMKGAGSTSNKVEYTVDINDRFIGTTYYRLVQHDYDGKKVIYPHLFSLSSDIDNDFYLSLSETNEAFVHLRIHHEALVSMQLFSIIGNTLSYQDRITLTVGEHILPVDKKLTSGLYLCSILLDNKIHTQKFIIQ